MKFSALFEVGLIFVFAPLSLGLIVCMLSRTNRGGLVAALELRPRDSARTSLYNLAQALGSKPQSGFPLEQTIVGKFESAPLDSGIPVASRWNHD